MNKIVSLYLANKNIPVKMDVVQGATAPAITFVLEDYTPNAGAQCQIYIKKKNSEVYRSCTLSGNEVTFEPTTTSFDEVGLCTAQLQITSGGKIAVSYRIHVMVEPNIIDGDAIEAADDFSALQQAIIDVGNISEYKAQTDQNTSDIAGITGKTNKITINNNTTDVYFGNDSTLTTEIWGNSANKVVVGVSNSQDDKLYYLLAKDDGGINLYDSTSRTTLFRLGPYPKGTVSLANCIAHGYSTNTPGRYFFWLDTPRQIPDTGILSNAQITNASIRSDSGLVVDSQDITANIVDFIISTTGKPRVQFQGLTNGFKSDHPAFLTCTLSFRIS